MFFYTNGTASIIMVGRGNQSAEVNQSAGALNQYAPTVGEGFDSFKTVLRKDNYHQPQKAAHARKLRNRRNVMQMARMLKCMSGCNPLSYRGYGCYCGYMGAGQPVDDIDRCCLQHDWCYAFISCPQTLIYFVPYTWHCMKPGAAHCGIATVPGVSQKCATQLCECDREFARCISNYPCPRKKPECKAKDYVRFPAIINNDISRQQYKKK